MRKMSVIHLVALFLFVQCVNNVPEMGNNDSIEFESVWQYLKAYSIHQDECLSGSGEDCPKRLRDNPFSYNSPEEMMELLYDTLGGVSYTRYNQSIDPMASSSLSKRQVKRVVDFYALTPITAMLKITEFATGQTYQQFQEAIPDLSLGFKNCIIDLRNNGGGDLEELDSIIELFLPAQVEYIKARERIYDTLDGQYKTVDYHSLKTGRDASPYLTDKKFVVLMDSGYIYNGKRYGGTASAAEILAAALKDCAGAILAGERSYGKAIGQIHLHRRGRIGLQITFLQLKGISFGTYQNIGIQPDSAIEINENLPQALKEREYLLKAVRMVEPGITDITYTPGLSKLLYIAESPQGYVNVFEE